MDHGEETLTRRLEFGWRIPDFNEEVSDDRRGRAIRFRDQIFNFMDVIHGHFDTTWAGDHFFPMGGRNGSVGGHA